MKDDLLKANPTVLCELASVFSIFFQLLLFVGGTFFFSQASYYLSVKPLVDLTCRAIADTIKVISFLFFPNLSF